ncbi:MAG: fibrinogen-like YCDxxxxGGGW domain-containing protein [Bdellovibrionia bacterium]
MILYHHKLMAAENTSQSKKSIKLYLGAAVALIVLVAGARGYQSLQYSKKCGVPRTSCREHLEAGCTASGIFTVAGPQGVNLKAYCDQKTDQGGWMLVLNYNHRGGTNPVLNARKADLPLASGSSLGTDESGSEYWGHTVPDMMKNLEFSELRFHCEIANSSRVVDFKTPSKNCISYFKTGKGDCAGMGSEFSPLPDHSGKLPKAATGGFKDKGDYAMTEFPFFLAMGNHWGIHGLERRWECDEYNNGDGVNSHHQIFVR